MQASLSALRTPSLPVSRAPFRLPLPAPPRAPLRPPPSSEDKQPLASPPTQTGEVRKKNDGQSKAIPALIDNPLRCVTYVHRG